MKLTSERFMTTGSNFYKFLKLHMIMKWNYTLIELLLFKNKNWKDVLQPMNNMVYLAQNPPGNLFVHLLELK